MQYAIGKKEKNIQWSVRRLRVPSIKAGFLASYTPLYIFFFFANSTLQYSSSSTTTVSDGSFQGFISVIYRTGLTVLQCGIGKEQLI